MKFSEKIRAYFTAHRSVLKPLLIALFGIALVLGASGVGAGQTSAEEDELTRQVREFCESVDGVGECRVMISYKNSGGGYFSSDEREVMAVAVACRGASSVKVRESLTSLLTTLFDIGANRVSVFKLE